MAAAPRGGRYPVEGGWHTIALPTHADDVSGAPKAGPAVERTPP
jgi:hypothetical protein